MKKPSCTIIIPAKNEVTMLPKLLKSINKQKDVSVQVILADAKSTDGTQRIAQSLGAKVIAGGLPAVGRNKGVPYAKFERILFLDADTRLPDSRFLYRSLIYLQNKQIDVATTFTTIDKPKFLDHLFFWAWDGWIYVTQLFFPHAPGYCIFSTKKVHNAVNGFDERIRLGEDANYVFKAFKAKAKFSIISQERIITSSRRLRKEGYWGMGSKMIMCGIMRLFGKEDYNNRFKYEYNH